MRESAIYELRLLQLDFMDTDDLGRTFKLDRLHNPVFSGDGDGQFAAAIAAGQATAGELAECP